MNGQRSKTITREELAGVIAAEVEDLLVHHDETMTRPLVMTAGRLAGTIASTIAFLSLKQQKALAQGKTDLDEAAEAFIASLVVDAKESVKASADRPVSISTEGIQPVAKWAGPCAGPTYIETNYGIARSTLHRWQRRGEAIALKTGGRKHVFPLAQFVDGRPARGIDLIVAAIDHPRLTWLWLSHPCPQLNNRIPIEMLKQDRVEEVLKVAWRHARKASSRT